MSIEERRKRRFKMTHLTMEFFLLVAASVAPVISAVHGDPERVYNYILMQRMMDACTDEYLTS